MTEILSAILHQWLNLRELASICWLTLWVLCSCKAVIFTAKIVGYKQDYGPSELILSFLFPARIWNAVTSVYLITNYFHILSSKIHPYQKVINAVQYPSNTIAIDRRRRSIFDIGGWCGGASASIMHLRSCTRDVWEAGKFWIFETGIVQYNEHFLGTNFEQTSKK